MGVAPFLVIAVIIAVLFVKNRRKKKRSLEGDGQFSQKFLKSLFNLFIYDLS